MSSRGWRNGRRWYSAALFGLGLVLSAGNSPVTGLSTAAADPSASMFANALVRTPPGLEGIVSASWTHTCGLQPDGSVSCWGNDMAGMSDSQPGPFVQAGTGEFHSCGLKPDGSVECWGLNDEGQAEGAAGPFTQIGIGDYHNCGLRPDGSVDCWGGAIFDLDEDQPGPYTAVVAGRYHTCGLKADGSVDCWGDNGAGQAQDQTGPFRQISAGSNHTCGIKQGDAGIDCWGANNYGQAQDQAGPFSQVSAGSYHTCALKFNGTVMCWGRNDDGQSADQTGPFVLVTAGGFHSCGLKLDGSVECWGFNGWGEAEDQTGPFGTYAPLDGLTARVSLDSGGKQGDYASSEPDLSADGRLVAFASFAGNLVSGDSNGTWDVFVHDRQTGETSCVSVNSDGAHGAGRSVGASISADGRFVAFSSESSNLVTGDSNDDWDAFVHDRQTGQTTRISLSSDGVQGNSGSGARAISADGRFVAFASAASNLATGDSNEEWDIFVHDRQTGQTTLVSADSKGKPGNGESENADISADGRYVAFSSFSSNLVEDDTIGSQDIFVHDRQTGQTTRVSVDSQGRQGNRNAGAPTISADGRFVAFSSDSSNLVSDDSNDKIDIFVHDRQTGETTRVSVDSSGKQSADGSYHPDISGDGRTVAFAAVGDDLLSSDTNGRFDVLVHDRQTGQTTRASVDSAGSQANGDSDYPALAADGRYVSFESEANNLTRGDINKSADIFVRRREIPLPDLQGVLGAGGNHTCALQKDGQVFCWGDDQYGQAEDQEGPLQSIDAGFDHTCGLTVDDQVVCWGDDTLGQAADQEGPFAQVSAGSNYNCGLLPDGSVDCWGGDNDWGETEDQDGPFTQIASGTNHNCAIQPDSTLYCWGTNKYGQGDYPDGRFHQISAGWDHTCGLTTVGSIDCWGRDSYGQVQDRFGFYLQVSAGSYHTCALTSSGSAECWGRNDYGQAANQVGPFTRLSAGGDHTCGLTTNGRVFCWGDNQYGQFAGQDGPFGPYEPPPPPPVDTLLLPFIVGG